MAPRTVAERYLRERPYYRNRVDRRELPIDGAGVVKYRFEKPLLIQKAPVNSSDKHWNGMRAAMFA
jgi:hypothetical protein